MEKHINIKNYIQSLLKDKNLSSLLCSFSRHNNFAIKLLLPVLIIFAGYYSCSNAQKIISDDINDIFTISDDIRSFYANKPDYWGLHTDFIVKNKIISKSFIRNNNIISRHGTELQIGKGEEIDVIMPSVQNFDIILKNLTKAQCISYAEFALTEEQLLKLEKIDIVNQQGVFTFEWGGNRSLPVKKYATKDLCLDKLNTIVWTLK